MKGCHAWVLINPSQSIWSLVVWQRSLPFSASSQSSTGNPSSSSSEDDEDVSAGDREGYICAVCLDVYFSPYMCHPCNHIFCEPCLRTLAKNSPTNTPCPLCRTIITHVFFQKGELMGRKHSLRNLHDLEYLSPLLMTLLIMDWIIRAGYSTKYRWRCTDTGLHVYLQICSVCVRMSVGCCTDDIQAADCSEGPAADVPKGAE